MYAIIDIETTGGNTQSDRITEIALYLHNGAKVVEEFVSLINPEKRIPYYITEITGITDDMVVNAPKFYEVAKRIVELTEGAKFVAHNAGFDYGFIRNEFKSLGYDFKKEKLCTVKLSRKLIPGKRSYSLGKLCKELGITLNNRHRAAGDALATVKLFEMLLDIGGPAFEPPAEIPNPSELGLHPGITKDLLNSIPRETGVYYFYNETGQMIYVGKSVNIRSRVYQHLNNNSSQKSVKMMHDIARIGWETTGSELVALLKESHEIKRYKPYYNRAQRRSGTGWGIYAEYGLDGYIRLHAGRQSKGSTPLSSFGSKARATKYLEYLLEKFGLCQKLAGLYNAQGPCFNFHIHKCLGACTGEEPPEAYNLRVEEAIEHFRYDSLNFFVIEPGRNAKEKAVVGIENGRYLGWGYCPPEILNEDASELKNWLTAYPDNRDVQKILKGYLRRNPVEKLIEY